MDRKTKDSVFAAAMILFGSFVLYEGMGMVARAEKPPFNIQHFRISPGMLPSVLGGALILFAVLLLIRALKEESRPAAAFVRHLRTSSVRFGRAFGEVDIRSMIACVIIMAVYTFGILGRIPFWAGAMVFLIGLMLFLRSAKPLIILASSAASVAAIMFLFQYLFKTTLP